MTQPALGEVPFAPEEPPREARYEPAPTRSFYLGMRDGVRLAVSLTLPEGLPPGTRIPTILHLTRYWRNVELRPPFAWFVSRVNPTRYADFFPRHGYATVMVDTRGSGASFGSRLHPWSEPEREDAREIVDWVVAQPWSNGRVGAMGASYAGTTAALLAATGHPAVRAVVVRFVGFDLYDDIAYPGGVFHEYFVQGWSQVNRSLDANQLPSRAIAIVPWYAPLVMRGVGPVDGDTDRALLRRAVAEHRNNGDLFAAGRELAHRDDVDPVSGAGVEDFSLHRFAEDISRSGVPIFLWGSWLDSASARGVLQQLLTLRNPMLAVIGPWNHVALEDADPYRPADAPVSPSVDAQWWACLRFFDRFLMEGDAPETLGRELHYFTMGAGRWRRTTGWPPAGIEREVLYLDEGALRRGAPPAEPGTDLHSVDFEATTGTRNRWHPLLTDDDVIYPDLAETGSRLVYRSEPLTRDMEITGVPVLHVRIASSGPDAALFAYLEDVAPDGRVRYVTEGQLRLIHRALAPHEAPYATPAPYRTYRKADARPLSPGRAEVVRLGLLPTSVRIAAGHRLRLSLGGHDRETFARIPPSGEVSLELIRGGPDASRLELPVAAPNPSIPKLERSASENP